ncbi:hypothetical protein Bbelb_031150 [Branchiostoma belcheri]|nr:hypothetical protein Bbelb_031150 [Branchiostoma belcheri]
MGLYNTGYRFLCVALPTPRPTDCPYVFQLQPRFPRCRNGPGSGREQVQNPRLLCMIRQFSSSLISQPAITCGLMANLELNVAGSHRPFSLRCGISATITPAARSREGDRYVCYVFSENVGKEWRLRTSLARHSHGCAKCKSVVCTPRLVVSGCVHRTLRKCQPDEGRRLGRLHEGSLKGTDTNLHACNGRDGLSYEIRRIWDA